MTATRNPRNYRKNPHTASFLQTFHTATREADRRNEETTVEPTEAQAISFVKTGQAATFAQPTAAGTYLAEIGGFQVRLGGDLLTEKQASFVASIANTREGVTDAMRKSLAERLEQGFAKAAASAFISTYKDLPRKAIQAPTAPAAGATATATEVPAGRYALRVDGVVKFYRLDRPTEGKWAGYVFLKAQASDELHPIRNRAEKDRIIAEIAKAPEAAATLYGTELGRCYACGRTLTDETSRALGIGPDCRNK